MKKIFLAILPVLTLISTAVFAAAPEDAGLGLQKAASPVMEELTNFHNMMLWIIFGIAGFVLLLLIYVMIRFNKRANPEPSKFSHNTTIEVIWTAIPVIILFIIAYPSLKLLYYMDKVPEPEMTLKVTGYQWYWGYEYPDHDGINFLSYMIPDEEIKEGQKRLLETDTAVVLPTDTNIQILVTAADVLHSWAMPAFGVKTDAVPGRFNETWVNIKEPGTYYGQCSEICGTGHAYMPIMVKAVPKEEFNAWVEEAKEEFASDDNQIDMSRVHEVAKEETNTDTIF